ncbi:PD-(D/E)XK nuclease family protein [Litoribacterium kuwaitense]|uniref:PD-(D/E)XK nuclease family protein n=1 Tax=Litoribacterium kuwaitense TaxID=1398745 RepID=UPI0028AF7EE3|nr:PD-(D/E)XK nuclease family protein [Litoribacterium kuwaitense]
MPFTYGLSAQLLGLGDDEDPIMIQGMIDIVWEEEDGWCLLDYKTDRILGRYENKAIGIQRLTEAYRRQIQLYCYALQQIWRTPVLQSYLYFMDVHEAIEVPEASVDEMFSSLIKGETR